MNKSIKLILNYFLGPLLFVVLSYSLYKQIIQQPDLPLRWAQIKLSWINPYFWLVVMLMFVNWGIESLKWKILMSRVETMSFMKSFKAVLSGCSITMLTPNRIGEYGGRVLYVHEGNRIIAVSLTVLGSISQLSVTILAGAAGMVYLNFSPYSGKFEPVLRMSQEVILITAVILSAIVLLFFIKVKFILQWAERIKYLRPALKQVRCIDEVPNKHLLIILFLSFLRYMVFILQYLLLLRVMQVEIQPVLCIYLLAVFYFLMALVPTIGFTELPVRAAASVILLKMFSDNILGMQAATFCIWLINLVIPSIIGSLFILSVKIIHDR